eukprot:1169304-Rhodomonas_salina.1
MALDALEGREFLRMPSTSDEFYFPIFRDEHRLKNQGLVASTSSRNPCSSSSSSSRVSKLESCRPRNFLPGYPGTGYGPYVSNIRRAPGMAQIANGPWQVSTRKVHLNLDF